MAKVYIIGEAGVNHNGDITIAKRLIEEAARIGIDAVKFQTFNSKKLVSKFANKAEYQKKTTDVAESQLKMLERLELSRNDHYELIEHCKNCQIDFLSSPFDLESIDFLNEIGLETFKIPSGEITNLPFLQKIGALRKKVILSTGMSTLSEVKDALKVLYAAGTHKNDITVLHCNTEYPTPMSDVNLLAMNTMGKELQVRVGYSDHTNGIEVPIAAVALGACMIEKHFTLDRNMEGPDHKASLEPYELEAMTKGIRNIEVALGDGVKKPSASESKNMKIARKSIVALSSIKKGDTFSPLNIAVKRPGSGISPMLWDDVIGKCAQRDFNEDELIEL